MIKPREIKTTYVHTCSACKSEKITKSKSRPDEWTRLLLERTAFDWHGSPCGSADIERMFCGSCSRKVNNSINGAFI